MALVPIPTDPVDAVVDGRAEEWLPVPTNEALKEFRSDWLPNITDNGLIRLIDLLEKASPLLIHGAFTRAVPMGCLASHIGWNHHCTSHLEHEAGVMWLCRIAKLNPATSLLIQAWDRSGGANYELRAGLLEACREEVTRRSSRGSRGDAVAPLNNRMREVVGIA